LGATLAILHPGVRMQPSFSLALREKAVADLIEQGTTGIK
jgi:hypothetical protein